jgi:hypothetical protein
MSLKSRPPVSSAWPAAGSWKRTVAYSWRRKAKMSGMGYQLLHLLPDGFRAAGEDVTVVDELLPREGRELAEGVLGQRRERPCLERLDGAIAGGIGEPGVDVQAAVEEVPDGWWTPTSRWATCSRSRRVRDALGAPATDATSSEIDGLQPRAQGQVAEQTRRSEHQGDEQDGRQAIAGVRRVIQHPARDEEVEAQVVHPTRQRGPR